MIMKKEIWKIELEEKGCQTINIPKGYQFLTVQLQKDTPCIWVLVNPKEKETAEHFEIYGTGHEITYDIGIDREYLGTWQERGLVWHLFKVI